MKREFGTVKTCPGIGVGNIKAAHGGGLLGFNVENLPLSLYVGDQVSFRRTLHDERSWAIDLEAAGPPNMLSKILRHREFESAERDRQLVLAKEQERALEQKELRRREVAELAAKRALAEAARVEEAERRQQEAAEQEAQRALARVRESNAEMVFEEEFLNSDEVRSRSPDQYPPEPDFVRQKLEFARRWVSQTLGIRLDDEQTAAIVARERNVLIRARAGSGKTRTLVCRVLFLILHCKIQPDEVLVVAFNKKAVGEVVERLKSHLVAELPYVMTFHALAYALVHPEETLVYDDDAGSNAQSREVQNVIDRLLLLPESLHQVRDLMLRAFREDWESIVRGRHDKSVKEFLEYRRTVAMWTLGGDFVKSYGERLIANTLFEHDIRYKYEDSHHWGESFYRPDFTAWQGKCRIIIEYFGMDGDEDYDKQSKEKRDYCTSRGINLLEYSPRDVAGDQAAFANKLILDLESAGIKATRLTEEEIWCRIKDRAIDSFTSATKQFVSRCRKLRYSGHHLGEVIAGHDFLSDVEADFVSVASTVLRHYEDRLTAGKMDDFDGLMWRAVSKILSGTTRFARKAGQQRGDTDKLRFVLVDEYQDFSPMFDEIIGAMRRGNDKIELFCVGDDWQAINRFAGSNSVYFTDFANHHHECAQINVLTNYRSHNSITSLGNVLMSGLGQQAMPLIGGKAGKCQVALIDKFLPTPSERIEHKSDELTPAVMRIVKLCLDDDHTVTLLARRNALPWRTNLDKSQSNSGLLVQFQEHLRSYFPEEMRSKVSVSTIHSFKGRESDVVVVLDAVKGSYPFIHPNWMFTRIFGDTLHQLNFDERCLLYVAVTRARKHLILLTESGRECEYIDGLRSYLDPKLDLNELPVPDYETRNRFEIEVVKGYEFRSELRERGFRFDDRHKTWRKSFDGSVARGDVISEANELFEKGLKTQVIDDTGQRIFP